MSNFFTRAAHARLTEELTKFRSELSTLSRAKGAAAAEGDLSENAEYHATREKLTMVQRRIYELEEQLRSPRFIEELAISCTRVSIGTKVRCLDLQSRQEVTYMWLQNATSSRFSRHLAGG
jgi:transcription elongation factor GreA